MTYNTYINTDCRGDVLHTEVKPPYLRLVSTDLAGISVIDMRFSQPNVSFVAWDVLHSIEHCLNVELKKMMGDQFICAAPLGCGTGMWLITKFDPNVFSVTLARAIKNIIDGYTEVPLCTKHLCGNYRNHSLEGAKIVLQQYLDRINKWNEVY